MKKQRIYKNSSEENFCEFIRKLGYEPSKRGWPDFICINKTGEIIIVEVKHTANHPLKKEQLKVMKILSTHGLPTFRWDSESKTLKEINQFSKRKPTIPAGPGGSGNKPL